MTSSNLERLARAGELKAEHVTSRELERLLQRATELLQDAANTALSPEGRFSLAYSAAHCTATAALRMHGYRAGNRYLVFQCLEHTAGLSPARGRLFTLCHERRNRAEYEGYFQVDESLLEELIVATAQLTRHVAAAALESRQSPPPDNSGA